MAPTTDDLKKKAITPLIIPPTTSYSTLTPPLTPLSPSFHLLLATPPLPPPHLLLAQPSSLLGTGAWSYVYALHNHPIAIKSPLNSSAHPVLTTEAKILHHLTTTLPRTPGIASFHGYDPTTATIYLDLIPGGTLEDHVLQAASQNTHNMRAPIVGMAQWLFLAERLVRTFVALKRKGVVHGDVKWSNILLREWTPCNDDDDDAGVWSTYVSSGEGRLWEPVLVDFSSSHVEREGEIPDAVSAVTTSFAAPELLQSFLKPVAHPVPSFGSDLYSLALSLLAAAVGSEVYANAGRHVGIYVRQGNPVGWVKADERGMRVGRGGVVAEVLEGCFGKTAEGRTGVEEVGVRVEGWKRKWWTEGRVSGNARWGC